jgi:hypothetical protein
LVSPQEQDFVKFETLIQPWISAYQFAVITYVALKTEQQPALFFGRVLLESSKSGISNTPLNFESKHVIAARSVASTPQTSDLASLLEKARDGEIPRVDIGGTLSLIRQQALSTFFAPIYHPLVVDGPRLPSLIIRGLPRYEVVAKTMDARELDLELKTADAPFDNLDELLIHLGLPTTAQMGDSSTLEIVARSPGMIDPTSIIKDGEAIVECRLANSLQVSGVKVGYKVFRKDKVDRGHVPGSEIQWRQDNDMKMGSYRVSVGDAFLVQVFLSFAGTWLHQWWISNPQKRLNPRHAIHQVFDEDLELLKQRLLKPETDKPYAFEEAVSTLLHLLGFSVSNYGRIPKLQQGPDIIAVSPSGHIGVVECTVGLLDQNDKLAKLVQRTKLIRDKLNGTGYGFVQTQPVIVTPLTKDEVRAHLETAGKHDIAVVCKENLEEMIKRIVLIPNADQLFQEAKRLIPSVDEDDLFAGKI